MHVKSQPQNAFFLLSWFWLSCLLVELSCGQVKFGRLVVFELLFGRVVAHSISGHG
jgi:hypothetical protein